MTSSMTIVTSHTSAPTTMSECNPVLVETIINKDGIPPVSKGERNRQSQNGYEKSRIDRPRQTIPFTICGCVSSRDYPLDNVNVTPLICARAQSISQHVDIR